MKVLRRADYPEGKFTTTFIVYRPEPCGPTLELTNNWDQKEPYDQRQWLGPCLH